MTNAMHDFDPAIIFNREFDAAIAEEVAESGFEIREWFRNGNQLPENAIEQWRTQGPQLVERFIAWFESSDYEIWVAPDGRPAIELELNVMFGTVPVRMFIDLILVNQYGLCVVDLKSGAKRPESIQQLGIYASGVELTYGIRPLYGSIYLGKGSGPRGADPDDLTYFQTPTPLTAYELSLEFFTEQFEAMERAIAAEAFTARMSKDCDRCGVAWACKAVGGIAAPRYDPSHPEYVPF